MLGIKKKTELNVDDMLQKVIRDSDNIQKSIPEFILLKTKEFLTRIRLITLLIMK